MLVIKIGGAEGINRNYVCDDVAELTRRGTSLVLIHGASSETNRVAEALGHPPRFITSPSGFISRYTDPETLKIFQMVYCGSVNKDYVARLQARGVNAVGLSGVDGRLFEGRQKVAIRSVDEEGRVRIVRDSLTGTVEHVNAHLLRALLQAGYVPVLTPPGISESDKVMNVDGDRAAARVASTLEAEELLLLSNVPGLLRAFPEEGSLVSTLDRSEVDEAMNLAEGRMRIKLKGAAEALDTGVPCVRLGDARRPNPILSALEGNCTTVTEAMSEPSS